MGEFSETKMIRAELEVEVKPGTEQMLVKSVDPDSKEAVESSISRGKVIFTLEEDKISTVANVMDDIIRCYETFKKMVGV